MVTQPSSLRVSDDGGNVANAAISPVLDAHGAPNQRCANRSGQQDFAWQISPSSTPGRTIGTRLVQYTETIRMHRQVFQQPAGRNVTNEA
jgi:hypothetical protein